MKQSKFEKTLAAVSRRSVLQAERDVQNFITAYQLAIKHLEVNEALIIKGFGTVKKYIRPARIGRNPKTGVRVEVPAKVVIKFKFSEMMES